MAYKCGCLRVVQPWHGRHVVVWFPRCTSVGDSYLHFAMRYHFQFSCALWRIFGCYTIFQDRRSVKKKHREPVCEQRRRHQLPTRALVKRLLLRLNLATKYQVNTRLSPHKWGLQQGLALRCCNRYCPHTFHLHPSTRSCNSSSTSPLFFYLS